VSVRSSELPERYRRHTVESKALIAEIGGVSLGGDERLDNVPDGTETVSVYRS